MRWMWLDEFVFFLNDVEEVGIFIIFLMLDDVLFKKVVVCRVLKVCFS